MAYADYKYLVITNDKEFRHIIPDINPKIYSVLRKLHADNLNDFMFLTIPSMSQAGFAPATIKDVLDIQWRIRKDVICYEVIKKTDHYWNIELANRPHSSTEVISRPIKPMDKFKDLLGKILEIKKNYPAIELRPKDIVTIIVRDLNLIQWCSEPENAKIVDDLVDEALEFIEKNKLYISDEQLTSQGVVTNVASNKENISDNSSLPKGNKDDDPLLYDIPDIDIPKLSELENESPSSLDAPNIQDDSPPLEQHDSMLDILTNSSNNNENDLINSLSDKLRGEKAYTTEKNLNIITIKQIIEGTPLTHLIQNYGSSSEGVITTILPLSLDNVIDAMVFIGANRMDSVLCVIENNGESVFAIRKYINYAFLGLNRSVNAIHAHIFEAEKILAQIKK